MKLINVFKTFIDNENEKKMKMNFIKLLRSLSDSVKTIKVYIWMAESMPNDWAVILVLLIKLSKFSISDFLIFCNDEIVLFIKTAVYLHHTNLVLWPLKILLNI